MFPYQMKLYEYIDDKGPLKLWLHKRVAVADLVQVRVHSTESVRKLSVVGKKQLFRIFKFKSQHNWAN